MKKIVVFTIAIVCSSMLFAQVGINTPIPDSSAVLDLSGPSNIGKGLLLPRAGDLNVDFTAAQTANGILVFDTVQSEFYFWDKATTTWYSLNRWKAQNGVNGLSTSENVTIGGTTETQGNINSVTGKVQEGGNDLVPRGTIVMWSGTTMPPGWGLCNGNYYDPNDNSNNAVTSSAQRTVRTPDLEGRFIVSYEPGAADYDQPGNLSTGGTTPGETGGAGLVSLGSSQVPLRGHTHTFAWSGNTGTGGAHKHTLDFRGTGTAENQGTYPQDGRSGTTRGISNTSMSTAPNHVHTVNVSGTTSATSNLTVAGHENRPPYYVLAYIFKL